MPSYIDGFNVGGQQYQILPSALSTQSTIDGVAFDGASNIIHYAVCGTAANVAAKGASVTGFTLGAGAAVQVKFTNGNTKQNPTLNVSGTGARPMMLGNGVPVGTIGVGQTVFMVYDGSNYIASAPLYMPISTLPALADVSETTLIPVDQSGIASKITGRQIKEWAVEAVSTATVVVQPVDDVPTAGSTYPVSSGGVYNTRVPVNGMGKNLLDNWYFEGSGDQDGYGNFPINQREQTSYLSGAYTIDRWFLYNAGNLQRVTQDGVVCWRVTGGDAGNAYLRQVIPITDQMKGKTFTFSFLNVTQTVSGAGTIGIGLAQSKNSAIYDQQSVTIVTRLNSVTYTVPANTSYAYLVVQIGAIQNEGVYMRAAKLELGEQQTLAHNEGTDANPNWVLNEIPSYPDELAKCQRYLLNIKQMISQPLVGVGVARDATTAILQVPIPVTMRNATATIGKSGTIKMWHSTVNSYDAAPEVADVYAVGIQSTSINFAATVTGGLTAGELCMMQLNTGARILVSVEL